MPRHLSKSWYRWQFLNLLNLGYLITAFEIFLLLYGDNNSGINGTLQDSFYFMAVASIKPLIPARLNL
ncbi:hypothetical protein QQP08_017086 [Theobroma cacao]|nr:hypothetical protein QQP08_017086 [Theobroma cacao]